MEALSSWKSTDDSEIELRRQRMLAEPMPVRPVGERRGRFRDYVVCRCDQDHVQEYVVELRSLTENINTCSCPDFTKNFASSRFYEKQSQPSHNLTVASQKKIHGILMVA